MTIKSIEERLEELANEAVDKAQAKQIQKIADAARIESRIEAKNKKYEEQSFADKDFEKNIDNKLVKMWLPSSVFVQQALLSLGEKVASNRFRNLEEETSLTEEFYKKVCAHLQINGAAIVAETLELTDLQIYGLLYWVELLAPLSAWGDVKARKVMQS